MLLNDARDASFAFIFNYQFRNLDEKQFKKRIYDFFRLTLVRYCSGTLEFTSCAHKTHVSLNK